jgi:hypothetical protein
LAAKLNVEPPTLNRYLKPDRLPSRATVTRLVGLVRENGGTVDETTVWHAYAAAEKVWPEWRRQNGHPSPPLSTSEATDTETSDSYPAELQAEREDDVNQPAGVVYRADRGRRRPVLIAGIAAFIIGAAGVGIAALLGAFHTDDPQLPKPSSKAHCFAASCEGKNHNDEGCNEDALTLPGGKDNQTAIVEVMYSPTCGAAWGKAKGAPGGAVIKIVDTKGSEQRALVRSAAGESGPKPTPMLSAPAGARLRACINTDPCTDLIEIPAE